jgi:hypothetical protein
VLMGFLSSITIFVLCPISKFVFIVIQHYIDMVPFCVYMWQIVKYEYHCPKLYV